MLRVILSIVVLIVASYQSAFAQFTLSHEWSFRIGTSGWDDTQDVTKDAAGNSYVTGVFSGTVDFDFGPGNNALTSAGLTDVFFAKYDVYGGLVWAKSLPGAGGDVSTSISIDNNGNVYVAGYYFHSFDADPGSGVDSLVMTGLSNIFFGKYDANGNYLWAKSLGMAGFSEAHNLRVNGTGDVFVSGTFLMVIDLNADPLYGDLKQSVSLQDIFIVKYTTEGIYVWGKQIGGSGNQEDEALELDASGNIVLAGWFNGTPDFDPGTSVSGIESQGGKDVFLAKYDPSGNYLWAKSLTGAGNAAIGEIAVDELGSIYITGSFVDDINFDMGVSAVALGELDGYFAKYDGNGNCNWAHTIGSAGSQASVNSVALDPDGNVYLTGGFGGITDFDPGSGVSNLPGDDFFRAFVASYTNNGSLRWADDFEGDDVSRGNQIVVKDGYIYATIAFQGLIDADPGPGNTSFNSLGDWDVFFGRYGQSGVGIDDLSVNTALAVYQDQSNGHLNVLLEAISGKGSDLTILSASGQQVYQIFFDNTPLKAIIDASQWPAGLYIIAVNTDESVLTNRLILNR